jgi:hypothetical protein
MAAAAGRVMAHATTMLPDSGWMRPRRRSPVDGVRGGDQFHQLDLTPAFRRWPFAKHRPAVGGGALGRLALWVKSYCRAANVNKDGTNWMGPVLVGYLRSDGSVRRYQDRHGSAGTSSKLGARPAGTRHAGSSVADNLLGKRK